MTTVSSQQYTCPTTLTLLRIISTVITDLVNKQDHVIGHFRPFVCWHLRLFAP